ncbi:MAG TPA: transaldolase [Sunxiuqinia sp.]|nr:transaldolase [Sunxiuqinia sp.]
MEKFNKLLEYGQSYWLDNLSREMISNGELKRRIEKEGLRGITSNPSIFQKALAHGNLYDEQIKQLSEQGKSKEEIYETVAVKDIQDACDLMRPVYDSSDGLDGYVSLEVSPLLARDTEGTKEEARRLYKAVGRPNCFIKIPGTAEGVPAIEEMLYEGININVTLLFSIESYEAVAKAYINALDRRAKEGKPVDKIASVASFFLSRIDVLVDKQLREDIIPKLSGGKEILADNLLGEAAIASSKIAYRGYKQLFSGETWNNLASKGARVQRLLWASTSNKTEGYRDTRYVEPLIGMHTVNTMPEVTIEAFKDHGKVVKDTIEKDVDEALNIFLELEQVGINLKKVTDQLVEEGIEKFNQPFDQLLKSIEEKIK